MWSLLCSPVTWIRNWTGNEGMKVLDAATNSIESFINNNTTIGAKYQSEQQLKFTTGKTNKALYDHISSQYQDYIMNMIRGEDVKYEVTSEKAADTRRAERKIEYENATSLAKKMMLKAQDMTDWGLSTGFLGDEPMLRVNIAKNIANILESNKDYLLKGLKKWSS